MNIFRKKLENIISGRCFALSTLLFFIAVLAYFRFSLVMNPIPIGYDPGFFRFTLSEYLRYLPNLPGDSLPTWIKGMQEPLFGIIGNILSFIGFSKDFIIGPFLSFLSFMIGIAVYGYLKQSISKTAGILGLGLFALSIIQFQELWWDYWRNILGILFLISSFTLLHKKSPLSVITIAGLFAIHRASFLFFTVVFIIREIGVLIYKIKETSYKKFLYVLLGVLIALPLFKDQTNMLFSTIKPLVGTFLQEGQSGSFTSTRDFLFLVSAYFIFLLPGISKKFEDRQFDIAFIGFMAGLLWSTFRLFFYNRMLVFFDIFLIFSAASAFDYYYLKQKNLYKKYLPVAFLIIIQTLFYSWYAINLEKVRTISKNEFEFISSLDKIVPKDSVILSTHRVYTPWLLGYSGTDVLAPGMLTNKEIWDQKKWMYFYFKSTPEEKCEMIKDYTKITKRLYVFVGKQQPKLELPPKCFKPLITIQNNHVLYETVSE